jgi:hypothetical protein
MADYYTQISMQIENMTPEEITWFEQKLDSEMLTDEEYLQYREGYTDDLDEKENWPPFRAAIHANDRAVWFTDDAGDIDIEALCALLCDFLRDWRPHQCICLEWANTCSKPRLDSFTGGAAFITHNTVEYHSTYDWLAKQEDDFDAKIQEVDNAKQ